MTFEGAQRNAIAHGEEPLASISSELAGNDPVKWRHSIPHFGRVRVAGLYPGIDAIFYGNGHQFEFDLELAPGANASNVAIRYSGASIRLSPDGDLQLLCAGRSLVQHAPKLYQQSDHGRELVNGRYSLDSAGALRFALGAYDRARPLVIDPVISYGSLLGGAATDSGSYIAADASGNMYIGYTLFPFFNGSSFVSQPPHVPANSSSGSLVVEKYTAAGALVWATRFGGTNSVCIGQGGAQYTCTDNIKQLVVDSQGSVAIVGYARNSNYPLKNPLYSSVTLANSFAPFVSKLNAAGTDFLFSTFFGALNQGKVDSSLGSMGMVGTDSSGNTYVAGDVTSATALILTPNNFMNLAQVPAGTGTYGFAAKFDRMGGLVYSVLIGTTGSTAGGSCSADAAAVDQTGNLYVAGSGCHGLEVTPGAMLTTFSDYGGYAAKLNPAGTDLVYATYLVGMSKARSVAVDSAGAAYILGDESARNGFTTTAGVYRPNGLGSDPWTGLTKLNPTGSARIFATYVGLDLSISGTAPTFPQVFVDNQLKPWLVYFTALDSEILTDAPYSRIWIERLTQYSPAIYRSRGTYAVRLAADASAIEVGTFLNSTPPGSNSLPYYDSVSMDPNGNLYVTGPADMLPVLTPNAYQSTYGGGLSDIYIVKLENIPSPTDCTYSVTPGSVTYPFSGGDLILNITPTPLSGGCQWQLTGLPSWIQPWTTSDPGTQGTGLGVMQLSLAQNGSTLRTAMLSVGGVSVPVSQTGLQSCTLQLNNAGITAAIAGQTGLTTGFTISPSSCGWLATTTSSWISISSSQVGTGNGSVTFSVAPNGTASSRSGTIVINSQAFTVTQDGPPPVLRIAETPQGVLFVDQSGATYTIVVSNQAGAGPTAGQVTVTETLPSDFTLLSMSGTGWTCPSGGLTCTRSDALNGTASFPAITLKVHISAHAAAVVTNHVAVSGGGSPAASVDDIADISPLTCNVNADQVTDVADVASVLKELLGISFGVHDLNHDGMITTADLQKVINAAIGLGCS